MVEEPIRKTEGTLEGSRIQGSIEVQTGNDQEGLMLQDREEEKN